MKLASFILKCIGIVLMAVVALLLLGKACDVMQSWIYR